VREHQAMLTSADTHLHDCDMFDCEQTALLKAYSGVLGAALTSDVVWDYFFKAVQRPSHYQRIQLSFKRGTMHCRTRSPRILSRTKRGTKRGRRPIRPRSPRILSRTKRGTKRGRRPIRPRSPRILSRTKRGTKRGRRPFRPCSPRTVRLSESGCGECARMLLSALCKHTCGSSPIPPPRTMTKTSCGCGMIKNQLCTSHAQVAMPKVNVVLDTENV